MTNYPAWRAPSVTASVPGIRAAEVTTGDGDNELSDGVSTHMLGLWIDLVRQAEGTRSVSVAPQLGTPTALQLRALECLSTGGAAISSLARVLGVSDRAMALLVDELINSRLVTTEMGGSSPVRLISATSLGEDLASEHRRVQIATLQSLLAASRPAFQLVLNQAMQELLGSAWAPALRSLHAPLAPKSSGWR